jgi:hypothetical protein
MNSLLLKFRELVLETTPDFNTETDGVIIPFCVDEGGIHVPDGVSRLYRWAKTDSGVRYPTNLETTLNPLNHTKLLIDIIRASSVYYNPHPQLIYPTEVYGDIIYDGKSNQIEVEVTTVTKTKGVISELTSNYAGITGSLDGK